MAATPTRRVLGVLDANKPIPSPMLSTPSKGTAAAATNFGAVKDVASSLQKLRSPISVHASLPSSAPLSGVKRKQVQEDVGSPKRQRALSPRDVPATELETKSRLNDLQEDLKANDNGQPTATERDDIGVRVFLTVESPTLTDYMPQSHHESPQQTPSPFAIFDTTDTTQNTVLTEPEDVAALPLPVPAFPASSTPREITQEAREVMHRTATHIVQG